MLDLTGGAAGGLDTEDELFEDGGFGGTVDAEREGPSFEATRAERSMKLLYSYFAARALSGYSLVS